MIKVQIAPEPPPFWRRTGVAERHLIEVINPARGAASISQQIEFLGARGAASLDSLLGGRGT